MACNKNTNQILDIEFGNVNDEFNWINSDPSTPIQTTGGQLILNPSSATNSFRRGLGSLDPSNNRIRLQINLDIFRPQTSTANSICAVFGVYVGAVLIDEFRMFVDDISSGEEVEFNFDREYYYENIGGNVSLKVDFPEGWENEVRLDYLKCEDFNFCEDDVRTYFVIDELLELAKDSQSSAIQLLEWKIDDVETLTPDFFSENSSPGGNPLNDWFFAKADIDGSNRVAETTDPNSFNPFVSEWGLEFDVVDSFNGGKPIAVASGSDYGEGILTVGLEKPEILNGDLVEKPGAFFIDVDYSKNLKVVFNVIVNNSSSNVFDSPDIYRTYTILWDVEQCRQRFFYVPFGTKLLVEVTKDGFLFGLTDGVSLQTIVGCDESFSYNGNSGTFEFQLDFGTDVGQAGIDYNAFGVPDKFEIEWNGNVYSSGYVGSSNSDQQLLNLGIPQSEINTGSPSTGAGTLTFPKTTATPTVATIRVTAPLAGTAWNIAGRCPEPNSKEIEVGIGECDNNPTQWNSAFVDAPSSSNYIPQNGDVIYQDSALTTPYDGGGENHKMRLVGSGLILDSLFRISSNGIVSNYSECSDAPTGNEINVNSSEIEGCFSCWSITVDVPQGEQREVQFIFNMGTGGNPTVCPGAGTAILANTTETITASKSYRIGVDADDQGNPADQETSTINVIVRNNGAFVEQQVFSRTHNDQNC